MATSARSSGKLADMLILDASPLTDIKNTATVRYVVVNGRIFDASNMAQLGNHASPAPKPTWRSRWTSSRTMVIGGRIRDVESEHRRP